MRLAELGIDRDLPTVVVLGAGASRGSTCVRPTGIAPPVDADFFAQAQRMPASELRRRDRELFSFIRTEFGQRTFPTLEVFFTQIAAVDRFHHDFNIQGRVSQKFGKHLATLRSLIPRVFKEALGGRDCQWHERIATSLRAGDAVLSFNYDTLMDRALRNVGGKRWAPAQGYGFGVTGGLEGWTPPPGPGPTVKRPILLLKPHGSLNWHIDVPGSVVSLVEEYAASTPGSIVPPTWDKSDVGQWPWNDVWRSARRALAAARMLVVVGYSVPVTNQLSQALLRADVNRLEALVVVNPEEDARRRVIDVMSSGLGSNAPVVELSTMAEFASYLPPSKTEPRAPDLPQEMLQLRRRLARILKDLEDVTASHAVLEEAHEELKFSVEELESVAEQVEASDLSGVVADVARLSSDVSDLDARIDSLLR